MKDTNTPSKLRPFIALGFDYHESRTTPSEAHGDCIFCGGKNKLYINLDTGQWSCMAGKCQLRGNTYTFVQQWYQQHHEEQNSPADGDSWNSLANDRHLSPENLKDAGIVYDGETWYIPVRNSTGSIVNLRRYTLGKALFGLPEFDTQLFGAEALADDQYRGQPVFICEGEWDAIALRIFLEKEKRPGVVIGTPGAGVWKDTWIDPLIGRDVVICYDKDSAGAKGTNRVWLKLRDRTSSIRYVSWPEALPDGFDVRDFVTRGGVWSELDEMISEYVSDEQRDNINQRVVGYRPPVTNSNRPTFDRLLGVFGDHLHMTDDMSVALRIICAVVLSNQIPGDPLWMHIVSPPGTAKTALLMSLQGCASCYFASTLTPHSLVSGFSTQGGSDPSLLPKLDGKTFVLKDFTEILNMPRVQKDEIYGTLRGAYDGSVQKQYGNGIQRNYEVRFNMLSGVTHSVFGERSASLGERFLLFHLVKGVAFTQATESIRAAIRNVGKEASLIHALQDATRDFLEVHIEPELIPDMPDWMENRIIALSSIVSMLRANVEKTYNTGQEKLLYRPQHEMGTRLAKQLSKLAYGLALVNSPPSLGEDEYRIVSRVALDTCVGFNLESIAHLAKNGGMAIEQLCEAIDIPMSTLRDQLDDMAMLGAIRREKLLNPHGRGAPRYIYHVSEVIAKHWREAGLLEDPEVHSLPEKREVNRSIKRVRKRLSK